VAQGGVESVDLGFATGSWSNFSKSQTNVVGIQALVLRHELERLLHDSADKQTEVWVGGLGFAKVVVDFGDGVFYEDDDKTEALPSPHSQSSSIK
jgi:hypothetical protein